jgi:hypothetical protein
VVAVNLRLQGIQLLLQGVNLPLQYLVSRLKVGMRMRAGLRCGGEGQQEGG